MTDTSQRQRQRTSHRRQQKLQRDSRRRTKEWTLSVEIDEHHPTAVCVLTDEDEYELTISGRKFEQPVTDYEKESWDMLVQRILTLHENAHVLYTDFRDLEKRLSENSDNQHTEEVYHSLWNIIEDARVENQICTEYPTYESELVEFRKNYARVNKDWNTTESTQDPQSPSEKKSGQYFVSVYEAVELGLLDKGLLDVGRYDSLLSSSDETYVFSSSDDRELFLNKIDPLIREVISSVPSESAPRVANEQIFEFINNVLPYIKQADEPGMTAAGNRDGATPARPDDLARKKSPTESDTDTSEDVPVPHQQKQPKDSPDAEESVLVDTEIAERLSDVLASEETEKKNQRDKQKRNQETEFDPEISRVEPAKNPQYSDEEETAERAARHIRSRLDLSPNTAEDTRNQRTGRVDSTSLVRAAIGNTRQYKKSKGSPDTVSFNIAFVMDRSASMRSRACRTAVQAILQSVFALDYFSHINVEVYDLYKTQVMLAMPLGSSPHSHIDSLTRGDTGGRTPLTQAISAVKERFNDEANHSQKNRMFVVTDGKPDNKSAYKDQLKQVQFPVVGLSIRDTGSGSESEYYHRHKSVCPDGDGLTPVITQLLSELTHTTQ